MTQDNNDKLNKDIENKIKNKSKSEQNYKTIKLLFKYVMENKKWWLIPFFIILVFFGIFISIVGSNSVMPILYVIF